MKKDNYYVDTYINVLYIQKTKANKKITRFLYIKKNSRKVNVTEFHLRSESNKLGRCTSLKCCTISERK